MRQPNPDLVAQSENHIRQLDQAVMQRNIAEIQRHTQEINRVRNILGGPTPLTDRQRRRLRAIADEIDKLDQAERDQLPGIADNLRALSTFGLR